MRKYLFAVIFPLGLLLLSCTPTTKTAEEKEPVEKTDFVGALTCKDCHEEQYASYAKSFHFKKVIKGPQGQEPCEACHGAGGRHVDQGGGPGVEIHAFDKKTDPKDKSARCLICHQRTPGMDLWEMGTHHRQDISCDACHTPMHASGSPKPKEPEVCFGCHRDIKIAANKRSHHPILEGKVRCSSCHAPHGSLNKALVKADDAQQLCFKCHADKRGPVAWAHPPVEENCLTCHDVHGSNHARLLTERIPQLCQHCHDRAEHPGTPYDNRASFASRWDCLRCHSAIHGSNSPSSNGRLFLR
jgi:DmsE family decaheme c-type cytochrome